MGAKAVRALLVLALLSFDSVAHTQTTPPHLRDRDRELQARKRLTTDLQRARLQFGPFYLLSTIELRNIGLQEEIDVPTRQELDDLSATIVAPQKLYFVPSRKFIVSAEVEPGYVWFRKHEELRTWNYLARADVHLLLNRLYVDVFAARADETVRDVSELGALVNREGKSVGVDAEIKFSSKTDVMLRSINSDISYDTTTELRGSVESLERTENSVWAGFRHKTFPRTNLIVASQNNTFDFDTATNRDGKLSAVYLGAERSNPGMSVVEEPITIRVGYGTLDYDDPAEEDYNGLLGSAQINYSPRRRLLFVSSLERRLEFSLFGENNHYAADRARLGANYAATRRVELHSSAEFGRNQYFIPTLEPLDEVSKERRDDLAYYSAGFRYRILQNSTVGLGVGYFERKSNFREFHEDGIRLLVQLSISP